MRRSNQFFIFVGITVSLSTRAFQNSLMVGLGPGVYNTENRLKNFHLTTPTAHTTEPTISTFKTKPAPFLAVAFSGTTTPHERCALSVLITGGVLPDGKACFTTQKKQRPFTEYIPAHFSGHFFISAYGSCILNFPLTDATLLQLNTGYGLNSEYLDVYLRNSTKIFSEFNRQFVGPFAGLNFNHTRKAWTFSANYQLMLGTAHNDLLYYTVRAAAFLKIPCIMNSIALAATYAYNNSLTFSLNGSYSRLQNYKNGAVSLCINNLTQPTDASVYKYFINSFALYLQGILSY